MERQLDAVDSRGLSVILCCDNCAFVQANAGELLSRFRDEISSVTAVGVIGVCVSYDCFLNGFPGIDIEISLFTVQPARRESYQPAPFHMRLFYRILRASTRLLFRFAGHREK